MVVVVVVVGGTVVVVVGGTVVVVGGTVVVVVVGMVVVVVVGTVLAGELEHPARRTAAAMVATTTARKAREEEAGETFPTFMRVTLTEPGRAFRLPIGDRWVPFR
ncbi:MAG TPA: hypothetical protein VND67_11230 [Acidimicrobiales bacterium]|nr:hypothetical protein [Acidimicrobiales bacterium]